MDPTSFSFDGINWLAIGLGLVFNFILGFVWYAKFTPMGRVWMREMKVDPDAKPQPGEMVKGLVLMFVGSFLTFFVLSHTFWAYGDAYTNVSEGGRPTYELTVMDGMTGGFFVWLGFFVPQQFSAVAWERRSWTLFGVNVAYSLISMLVIGTLLVVL